MEEHNAAANRVKTMMKSSQHAKNSLASANKTHYTHTVQLQATQRHETIIGQRQP